MKKSSEIAPGWIAVDWGTTHLRVWAMSGDGVILDHKTSDAGMASLSKDEFEGALLRVISEWLSELKITPVVSCGMVGSRQGWVEAPYQVVPCEPLKNAKFAVAATRDPRIKFYVVPGIKQDSPADVMRGEETQIAGLLAQEPDFDGVACLPGTHTKWVRISAGEVVHFSTYLTGELFSLLSSKSVLRHSIAQNGWDTTAFKGAIDDAITKPSAIAGRLFSLRSEALISELSPETARARLSGYLIGLELGAARQYWLGQKVVIIGEEKISDAYYDALNAQGWAPVKYDAELMTLAGISSAYLKIRL
ncbi:2-keto-3-deoxy-galactonokinase [Rhodobacterales bacterium 52_120_T64]|nr:2-keto-3-deoxy-galactonokinase [Rhodobacterales bacterium 52_120_T64]